MKHCYGVVEQNGNQKVFLDRAHVGHIKEQGAGFYYRPLVGKYGPVLESRRDVKVWIEGGHS